MSGEYNPQLIKSRDKDVIVEELLEKLKAQGCFDMKRKQFLLEITNKSTYHNLTNKVENLATKFLENVHWPPAVEKHQLREQLRLHIQSTDVFNNSIDRLVAQEVTSKIQSELKPLIERKGCEHLEVNFEKWKQNILKIENEELNQIQNELMNSPAPVFVNHSVVSSSNSFSSQNPIGMPPISVNQPPPSIMMPPSLNTTPTAAAAPIMHTYLVPPPHHHPPPSSLPPPISMLPHHPMFHQTAIPPPPPPHIFMHPPIAPPGAPVDRFPPPPPPEEKSLPPPPPPENGPNTPTDDYVPDLQDSKDNTNKPKLSGGMLKTPKKPSDRFNDRNKSSPKKLVWERLNMYINEVSDNSDSDSERIEREVKPDRIVRGFIDSFKEASSYKQVPSQAESGVRLKLESSLSHIVSVKNEPPLPPPMPSSSSPIASILPPPPPPQTVKSTIDYTDVSPESLADIDTSQILSNHIRISQQIFNNPVPTSSMPRQTTSRKSLLESKLPQSMNRREKSSSSSSSSSSSDSSINKHQKLNKTTIKTESSSKKRISNDSLDKPTTEVTAVEGGIKFSLSRPKPLFISSKDQPNTAVAKKTTQTPIVSSSSDSAVDEQSKNLASKSSKFSEWIIEPDALEEALLEQPVLTVSSTPIGTCSGQTPTTAEPTMDTIAQRKQQIRARLQEIDAKRSQLQKEEMLKKIEDAEENKSSDSSADCGSVSYRHRRRTESQTVRLLASTKLSQTVVARRTKLGGNYSNSSNSNSSSSSGDSSSSSNNSDSDDDKQHHRATDKPPSSPRRGTRRGGPEVPELSSQWPTELGSMSPPSPVDNPEDDDAFFSEPQLQAAKAASQPVVVEPKPESEPEEGEVSSDDHKDLNNQESVTENAPDSRCQGDQKVDSDALSVSGNKPLSDTVPSNSLIAKDPLGDAVDLDREEEELQNLYATEPVSEPPDSIKSSQ